MSKNSDYLKELMNQIRLTIAQLYPEYSKLLGITNHMKDRIKAEYDIALIQSRNPLITLNVSYNEQVIKTFNVPGTHYMFLDSKIVYRKAQLFYLQQALKVKTNECI